MKAASTFSLGATAVAASNCLNGPCMPGRDFCGEPFKNAPGFHLMDQHGCAENDPNGPVFDPVHGVFHHFYQIHLAAGNGAGPDYGHFVSKDFVNWADVRTAIWNGLDASVTPARVTPYDTVAIYTGSAVVVDGAGPEGKPGIVQIYPGLCNKHEWKGCETGTLLAQAIPADYANDPLLTNWTKPDYNPIMENTARDPSSPWKTSSGEWRLRTYDSMVYGSASDADMNAGKWYTIGRSRTLRSCECPSLYPLPASTAGFESEYETLKASGSLPTHVHKTSCGGDWWQLGDYLEGEPKKLGAFEKAAGWEHEFRQVKIDQGHFYASKDSEYPTKSGGTRRINWGWATVPPASTQSLPREVTFNAVARQLQQYPIDELKALRSEAVYKNDNVAVGPAGVDLKVPEKMARQSEFIVSYELPTIATEFGLIIGAAGDHYPTTVDTLMKNTDLPGGDYNVTHYAPGVHASVCEAACDADDKCKAWTYVVRGQPSGSADCCLKSNIGCPVKAQTGVTSGAKIATPKDGCGVNGASLVCHVTYSPPTNASATYYDVPVECSGVKDKLRLLTTEKTLEIRAFADWTFAEVFFQQGRVAMVVVAGFSEQAGILLSANNTVNALKVAAFPIKGIWTTAEDVLNQPRVYN